MNVQDNYDRQIESWLAEGPHRLPEAAIGRIVGDLDDTNTRRPTWLPRRETMNRIVLAAGSVAAVVLVAAIGIGLVSGGGLFGPGATPAATPAPEPTAAQSSEPTAAASPEPTEAPSTEPTAPPSPAASPRVMPEGPLQPGTYVARPADAANPLSVRFTVPEGWEGLAGHLILSADGLDLIGIQLRDVTNLNGDPCDWSGTADDVDVGTTVDDLVQALVAQTAYEVSEPVDVTIGGYSGKRVDIIHPAEGYVGPDSGDNYGSPGCDEGQFRIWDGSIYGQGPENRWQANMLDVEGTRLVVVAMDYPQTTAERRAELDALIDSLVIEP